MKEFDVTITETLKLTVSVEASSKEEAQQMVSDQWHAGDHILDADNFVEVEFESNDGKEISAERAQDDTLEVLMVEQGQYPRVERIGSDLASLQKAVDGYIEAIYPYDDPVALICGEEAKLEGKPLNRALRDEHGEAYDVVAGTFLVVGCVSAKGAATEIRGKVPSAGGLFEDGQQDHGNPHRACQGCGQRQDRSGDRAMIPSLPMRTEGGKTHAGRN